MRSKGYELRMSKSSDSITAAKLLAEARMNQVPFSVLDTAFSKVNLADVEAAILANKDNHIQHNSTYHNNQAWWYSA
jgi:hypothetical protein